MITYRLATSDDNQQLLELTAGSTMPGKIELRIDRKPDFFELLKLRGETKVFVAVNHGEVIGSICVSRQEVYISGSILPVYYIGDFRVAAFYRNNGIGLSLCDEVATYLLALGADLAFLNVSYCNKLPFSFFKDRPNIPDFDNIGNFIIHQFVGRKIKQRNRVKIEQGEVSAELITMLNQHFAKYELGPVITATHLEKQLVFVVRTAGKITAAICLADTMDVKQNIITRVPFHLKVLLRMLNACRHVFSISPMPGVNEPVKMLYIKYLAVNENRPAVINSLVRHAISLAYKKSYAFVSLGLHEKDPLNACFNGFFKLSFKSVGMLLSIKNNREIVNRVKASVPFEDYSLV